MVAAVENFLDGVLHVGRGDELAFFDVDGAAGLVADLRGGDEEVGLAAEEGGDLEEGVDVAEGVGEFGGLLGGVDVGEDGEAVVLGDGAEDARAFGEAGAAEAVDGGSVGFVVAGFEDVGDGEVGGDALDGVDEGAGVGLGLEDAGAGDEEEAGAADGDGAEGEFGGVAHKGDCSEFVRGKG